MNIAVVSHIDKRGQIIIQVGRGIAAIDEHNQADYEKKRPACHDNSPQTARDHYHCKYWERTMLE
jgi:hypothetical protein